MIIIEICIDEKRQSDVQVNLDVRARYRTEGTVTVLEMEMKDAVTEGFNKAARELGKKHGALVLDEKADAGN